MSGIIKRLAIMYRDRVHKDIAKYGLRYEDILNEFEPDTMVALKHLPKEEKEMRNRRLRVGLDQL